MVAGTGAAGALPAALVAARRLTRRGATALVDLGPSPSWLSDLFDRERDGGAVARRPQRPRRRCRALARAAHRDLSTSLDIIPSGDGAVGARRTAGGARGAGARLRLCRRPRRRLATAPPSRAAPRRTWRRCCWSPRRREIAAIETRARAAYQGRRARDQGDRLRRPASRRSARPDISAPEFPVRRISSTCRRRRNRSTPPGTRRR